MAGASNGGLEFRRVPDQPHEVHLVTFPDQESFERYRADADLLAMADLRARAIRQTLAWVGNDFPGFLRK